MRFQTFTRACLCGAFLAANCLSDDMAFISMAGDCRYPTIASEGNNIYLIWLVSEGRTASLHFKRSADEGKTWSSGRRISPENSDCFPPSVAAGSGAVHTTWIDYGETIDGEIYYARSLDGGESWEKCRILVENANSARYPLLTCEGQDVYLIWQDVENKVYFKASHDQGLTWDAPIMLGKVGKHSCYCYPPAVCADGKKVTVVWTDFSEDKKGLNLRLYGLPLLKARKQMVSSVACRTSTDNGRTWGKEDVLSACSVPKEMQDEIDNPSMLTDGSSAYLFWLDKRDCALGEIFYSRFDPDSEKRPVTGKALYVNNKRSPKRPSVVFDQQNNPHFTWASFFGGESVVHYGAIDSAGTPLKEVTNLTTKTGRYHNPTIARTPSGLMHIFWFDEPKDKEKWSMIFMKTSMDDGVSWQDWNPLEKDM